MEADKLVKALTRKIESGLHYQLGPEIFTADGYKFEFDLSEVGALQPDLNKMSDRMLDEYEAGLITEEEYREALGYDPDVFVPGSESTPEEREENRRRRKRKKRGYTNDE